MLATELVDMCALKGQPHKGSVTLLIYVFGDLGIGIRVEEAINGGQGLRSREAAVEQTVVGAPR